MKRYFIRWYLGLALVAFFLGLFFYFTKNDAQKKITSSRVENKAVFGLPVKLVIPAININANIQYLSVNKAGEMEVPNNITDVGWFKLGSRPGERGSAVIAGHLNGRGDEAGVFANLDKLKIGDKLSVVDDKSTPIVFVVWKIGIYDFGYADDVFSRNDGFYLNLITCDGGWDEVKRSYKQRLVVFTKIVN